MVRYIQCLEHETLVVGEHTGATITEDEVADLLRAQGSIVALKWIDRNRVRTSEQVGVIIGRNVRLEILPKIRGFNSESSRRTLIRMLAKVWEIPIHDGELAGMASQKRDLLEILIYLFARRLSGEIRRGLSRSYEQHRDDLPKLRGKLNSLRQYTRNAAYPHRISCIFDELTANNALNRLLLSVVHFLRHRTVVPTTGRLLSEISFHFEDVELITPESALRHHFVLNVADRRWRSIVGLARLLLEGTFQTTHLGVNEGIALLFDMNVLFESYVAALVREVVHGFEAKLTTQGPYRPLIQNERGIDVLSTRPDMHVRIAGQSVVLDTKWKQLDSKFGLGIGAHDFYQMHAYQRVYNSCETILIFPKAEALGESSPLEWTFVESSASLKVMDIDLEDPSDFVREITTILRSASMATLKT